MSCKRLKRGFYSKPSPNLAKDLLGKYLVRQTHQGRITARIVEVEAYRGSDDPASHAYTGMTARNRVMFGKPGLAYVYFIYGNHFCINIKAGREGVPGAVLIRAVEIIDGLDLAFKNRNVKSTVELSNGPGKLTKALDITRIHNGIDLTDSPELFMCDPTVKEPLEIVATSRIGIKSAKERLWRFYVKGSGYVSRK